VLEAVLIQSCESEGEPEDLIWQSRVCGWAAGIKSVRVVSCSCDAFLCTLRYVLAALPALLLTLSLRMSSDWRSVRSRVVPSVSSGHYLKDNCRNKAYIKANPIETNNLHTAQSLSETIG